METLKISLVDFIPDCLKTGFEDGKLNLTQKDKLGNYLEQVKEIVSINQIYQREFEPYLCFLNYLKSEEFGNKYRYEICLKKAVKLLKD